MIKDNKEQFLSYCESQLDSIRCAIDKKSRGSTVENGYFMEHLDKLKNYFLATEVRISKHYPKPEYDRCNAGHQLVEVYDYDRDEYHWDCPICIRKMKEARHEHSVSDIDPIWED